MTEDEKYRKIEKLAKALASLHGQTPIGRVHDERVTVASQRGYGLWAQSPEKYAERYWAEYRAAAEYVLSLSPRKKL